MLDKKEDVVCGVAKDLAGVGCLEWQKQRHELLVVRFGANEYVSLI